MGRTRDRGVTGHLVGAHWVGGLLRFDAGRVSHVAVAALAALVLLVTGCSTGGPVKKSADDSVASTSVPDQPVAEVLVGPEGFNARVGGVVVNSGSGVAPEGTTVRVSQADPIRPEVLGLDAVGARSFAAVEVVLGQNEQPRTPVTVTFEMPTADGSGFLVLARSGDSGPWQLVPSRAEEGAIIATSEHLSTFFLFGFDVGTFVDELLAGASELVGLTYPDPGCRDEVEWDGVTYAALGSGDGSGQAYRCLVRDDGQLVAAIHSNSPMTWVVDVGEGEALVPVASLDRAAVVTSALHGYLGEDGGEYTVMAPGSTARVAIDPSAVPVVLNLEVRPMLDALGATVGVVAGAFEVFGIKWKPEQAVAIGECMAASGELVFGSHLAEPDATSQRRILRTAVDCAATILGEGIKVLATLGVLASVLPVLAGRMLSVLVTYSGMDQMRVTVSGTAGSAGQSGPDAVGDNVWAPFEGSWEGVLPGGQGEGQPFDVHVVYVASDLNMWQAQLDLIWQGCSAPLAAVADVSNTAGGGQPAVLAEVGDTAHSWGEFCPDFELMQLRMLPDDTLEFSEYDGADHVVPIAPPMRRWGN